jgi:hypothetical protein
MSISDFMLNLGNQLLGFLDRIAQAVERIADSLESNS